METPLFIEVVRAEYLSGYTLKLEFNDGTTKTIDFLPLLDGEVYEPLKELAFFKDFSIKFNTIEWKNGADFAPEFLYRGSEGQVP